MTEIGRLLKRADFLRVQTKGQKWVTPTVIVQMAPMPEGLDVDYRYRFGLTATKKIFPRAVDRNRVRRRFRALMIDILAEKGGQGVDFVVLPRLSSLKSPSDALKKDLKWAIKRLLATKTGEDEAKNG